MGLGLAVVVSFLVANGAKEVAGKPRPDLLARCKPDMSRLLNATIGGVGQQLDEGIVLVSWKICGNTGSVVEEGFRSFPSGHATFSFSGLTYLALWMCAKLSIAIPFLNHSPIPNEQTHNKSGRLPIRSQAAAPPTYLVIYPLFAVGLAIYVSLTRYSDFWHHGFDIIAGAVLGIATAWLGFYWYHLPIQRGGGWAWAPRSSKHAFRHGVDIFTYGNDYPNAASSSGDLETGRGGGHEPESIGDISGGSETILQAGHGSIQESFDMVHLTNGRGRRQTADTESSRHPIL
ncbi:MAG: hypothetical protein Q9218_006355 [Villophora microphyllina]